MKKQTVNKEWYTKTADETLGDLKSSDEGLSQSEAHERLKKDGPNIISAKKQSWIKRLLEPFTSLFVLVLIAAIIISLATGEKTDALIIGVVVVVNALIFYFQEFSVNRVLSNLKNQGQSRASVIRDGKPKEIEAQEIVAGDVVYLFEGQKVPADGRIIQSEALKIDEAILTGESLPVSKTETPLSGTKQIYEQKNMVFKGTICQTGSGLFAVTGIGDKTQLGAISILAKGGDLGKTPIEKKIDILTRKIVLAIAGAGAIVFFLALLRGTALSEALRFTLSLVVSVIPEGFPVTLTVVLLLSAKKMASRNALVKKLSAIETLGSVTLIATDKTGTLTENKLTIAEVYSSSGKIKETSAGSITKNNGLSADPLDELLEEAYKNEKIPGKLIKSFNFDQKTRMSGSVWKNQSTFTAYIKGAPEMVINKLPKKDRANLRKILEEKTTKGYRTIAFFHCKLNREINSLDQISDKGIVFDGFICLSDPLRKNIPSAVREAHDAGIKVIMLTGDNKNTAGEIAKQAGLATNSMQIADSHLLEKPPNKKTMVTIIDRIKVFGRVLPKHKFNFLKAVKGTQITAMTGDGINDIPALIEADAGLSMGSGTDAAKEASEIVLLDDNFSTIIEAVRLGRSVLANIKKMLYYLVSTSIGEAVTIMGALVMGLSLPITAVQILWVNLVTDTFTVLPIGLAKPENYQMKAPPLNAKAPLLPKRVVIRMLLMGVLIASSTLFVFWWLLPKGYHYAQTAAFTALVVAQWANALNANYEKHSWARNLTKPNILLWLGIVVSVLLQALVLFGPLKNVLGVATLSTHDILFAIILPSAVILLAGDIFKLLAKYSD